MALTRKFLTALGIEADKIDEIIEAHVETVNGIKAERDELKDKASKADDYEKELADTKAKLDSISNDGYKGKYENLQKEYDSYKQGVEAKEAATAKEKAYRDMLISAGVSEKRINSVMRVTDLKNVELEDGKIKDAEKMMETVKKEWADFIVETDHQGADLEHPQGDKGGKNYETMSMAEYAAARKKK